MLCDLTRDGLLVVSDYAQCDNFPPTSITITRLLRFSRLVIIQQVDGEGLRVTTCSCAVSDFLVEEKRAVSSAAAID